MGLPLIGTDNFIRNIEFFELSKFEKLVIFLH